MGTPVWKEVLCLGRHYDPRAGEWYEFRPAHIKRAHRNFQKMRSRGVPLPACWEHQEGIEAGEMPPDADALAEWKRRYARYTFAHALDSRLNERGNLDMLLDVADPTDVPRLEAVKFVSPKVYQAGYWDTKGGEYDGTTIAHVAATPTPVQFWQKPFSVNLSAAEALYLSFAPPDAPSNPPEKPAPRPGYAESHEWSFDAWLDEVGRGAEAVELSTTEHPREGDAVADEKDKGGEKKPEGGEKGGGKKTIADVIKALRDYGLNIPEEVEDEAGVIIAIKANGPKAAEAEPEPEPEPAPDESGTESAGGPPMLMSTLDKNDSRRKRAVELARPERKDAADRVKALFEAGKIDGPTQRKMLRQAESFELSFTADFEPAGSKWTKLLSEIGTAEKSEPKFRKKSDGSLDLSTTAVDAPPQLLGKGTTEGLERTISEQEKIAARHSVRPNK